LSDWRSAWGRTVRVSCSVARIAPCSPHAVAPSSFGVVSAARRAAPSTPLSSVAPAAKGMSDPRLRRGFRIPELGFLVRTRCLGRRDLRRVRAILRACHLNYGHCWRS